MARVGNATVPELEAASSLDLAVSAILQPPKQIATRRSVLGCYGICKPTQREAVRPHLYDSYVS